MSAALRMVCAGSKPIPNEIGDPRQPRTIIVGIFKCTGRMLSHAEDAPVGRVSKHEASPFEHRRFGPSSG